MAFPLMALPYQAPPQQVMAAGSPDPLANTGFFFVFAILAVALLAVSGLYGWHRFRGL